MCLIAPASRNQLSTLPGPICSLPLKVLIACNNKLLSLPEELGQLRQLTELVSFRAAWLAASFTYAEVWASHVALSFENN